MCVSGRVEISTEATHYSLSSVSLSCVSCIATIILYLDGLRGGSEGGISITYDILSRGGNIIRERKRPRGLRRGQDNSIASQ
jgi:hypothetical protein